MDTSVVYLKDYTPPPFFIKQTRLHFALDFENTVVESELLIERNLNDNSSQNDLVLDGESLELLSIKLDGVALEEDAFVLGEKTLTIKQVPERFSLKIRNRINPKQNTALSGLYQSKDILCTQCEAEGFRRITYFLDRPDVLSTYHVTLSADATQFPILLSNGNRLEHSQLEGGQHSVSWHDPHPKPSYLFALVAGDLAVNKDVFTTQSGRNVDLEVYVETHDIDKTDHAIQSLKNAMSWDEMQYGREYDLDLYMIVAVSHFNMGAMENKGLNIFNTKFVLANHQTATDVDYENIEAVIGHEYFHNWSGNRVTCRDWFQLSLKEGFTVFRDQQFTAYQTSDAVKRINDVKLLRAHQFVEDAGPLAHPIRPSEYSEINNFYTLTVYEKGAEVIRMLYTLLGEKTFRKGCDLYFDRFDGQAVTTEDFLQAHQQASGQDLSQFQHWYDQAGTPHLHVRYQYQAELQRFTVSVSQSNSSLPQKEEKPPYLMPILFGLINAQGEAIPFEDGRTSQCLVLTQAKQDFVFENITEAPTPSFLRGFSAPVIVKQSLSFEQQLNLFQHDSDPFNRWEAGQNCLQQCILTAIKERQQNIPYSPLPLGLLDAFSDMLNNPMSDLAYLSLLVQLPERSYVAEQMEQFDVVTLYQAYQYVKEEIARHCETLWLKNYHQFHQPNQHIDAEHIAQRAFKNVCLDYLSTLGTRHLPLCLTQFESAQNMTDQIKALSLFSHLDTAQSKEIFDRFYQQWQDEDLVIDKWFTLQALSEQPNALNNVIKLLDHPKFDYRTPNRVRSLIAAFSTNLLSFNAIDGKGYTFVADNILHLDSINPQVAARLAKSLSQWKKLDAQRQSLVKTELKRIQKKSALSKDVKEIIERSLNES